MSVGVAAARGLLHRDDDPTAPTQADLDDDADDAEPDTSAIGDVAMANKRTPAHERRFGIRNELGHLLATGTIESLRGMRGRTQPPGEVWRLVRLPKRVRGRSA